MISPIVANLASVPGAGMDSHLLLISLSSVIVLGIGAQWLAWRFQVPSILLLLATGIAAGSFVQPDALFGETLFPLVSISVALILFEGGLFLKFRELREIGGVLLALITIGALVTWFICAVSLKFLMGWDWNLSLLLGAIMVVTGPTVIGPLLRHVRPIGSISKILRWEGIVIDPVGATLAVLVFEGVLAVEKNANFQSALNMAFHGIALTIGVGCLLAFCGAGLIVILLRRYYIPDYLQSSFALMMVVLTFTLSNLTQDESGFLTVTLMGVFLTNQKFVDIKQIIGFKEDLSVLLISCLFILLAGRLRIEDFTALPWQSAIFILVVLFIARPASVFASTCLSSMKKNEKLFLSWMAPRGIVAAAVASIFSQEIATAGIVDPAQAEQFTPLAFLVIISTVIVYSLTCRKVAEKLGVASPDPQGFLIVGAHPWAVEIARILHGKNVPVLLVDTNWDKLKVARMEGIPTHNANILSENFIDELDLGGIGRILALTSNDEVNALAAQHFTELFGRKSVYQITPHKKDSGIGRGSPSDRRGRFIFKADKDFLYIQNAFVSGAKIKATNLTSEFGFKDFMKQHGEFALPMFLVGENGQVQVFAVDENLSPKAGQVLISLVDGKASETKTPA